MASMMVYLLSISLIIAMGILVLRAYRYVFPPPLTTSAAVAAATPFSKIAVFIYGSSATALAATVESLFTSAANPASLVVGVVQSLSNNGTGNVTSELRRKGLEALVQQTRVTLSKETQENVLWRIAFDELYDDEPYVAFLAPHFLLPRGWDRKGLSTFDAGNKIMFSAGCDADFPVCAGVHRGIPFFEGRQLKLTHDRDVAFPISAPFVDFMLCPAHVAARVLPTFPVPFWVLPSVIAARLHRRGCHLLSMHAFDITTHADEEWQKPEPHKHERFELKPILGEIKPWKPVLGWDYDLDQPTGRARMGLLENSTLLERRLKWGEEDHFDHMRSIAIGAALGDNATSAPDPTPART